MKHVSFGTEADEAEFEPYRPIFHEKMVFIVKLTVLIKPSETREFDDKYHPVTCP